MGEQITIIGGSGFVGRAITEQAVTAGHRVTVACRYPNRARAQLVKGARLAKVDVTDGSGLAEAVQGADCVINLVGLLFEKGRQNFAAAHVDGTANIIAACKAAGVDQLLHMSALGAGTNPESGYASTKAEAEALVRSSGLKFTIFRPSIIYGAGDNFFNQFKMMAKSLPVLPVISGDTKFQPVWVEDVARAFVASIGNANVHGATFELGGPSQYSFKALLQMMLDELGLARPLVPVPAIGAKLMAIFGSALPTPPITLDQLKMLAHDNVVEGDAFPACFGEAASLETVLPTFIHGSRADTLQEQLDRMRTSYRKGGV